MKKIIISLLLCFVPSMLLADTFIILWLNTAASTSDKVKVRDGLYTLLNDHSKINASALPQWRVVANPSTVGYVLVINLKNPELLKANMSNLTLDKLNQWKENQNFDNKNHLQWRISQDWEQALIAAGLERVPVENP